MSSPPSGETASWDNQHQRRASDPEVVVSKSGTSGTATEDTAPAGDKSKPRLPLPLPTALPELEIHIVSPGPGDERKGDTSTRSHVRSTSSAHHESSSSTSTSTTTTSTYPVAVRSNHSTRPPRSVSAAQMDHHDDVSSHHHLPPQPHHAHHPHHPGHPPPRHGMHPQATHAGHPPAHVYPVPSDSTHYLGAHPSMPTGASMPQPDQQIRYADQAYGTLRPVYAPQIYYDPSIAAAAAAAAGDYAVDPTHVYPGIPSRASPGTGYSPQHPVPPQFHPAATTPPVPQGAWTGSHMPPQAAFYGSYGGMAPQVGTQHTGGPSGMTDELGRSRSLYLPHAAPPPPSAWSASSVLSSHYGFYSPFTTSTERMENMSPVAEAWSPQPQARQLPARPGYVTPQAGAWGANVPAAVAAAAAAAAGPAGREHRGSWSAPGGEDGLKPPRPNQAQQHADRDRERKEYHPQPPARRSEWVMWVGNVPSNVSHEELWRFFNTTTPPSAMSNPSEPWRGPSSIFLISRSSCAFVNFSSQADLDRAVPFFHGLSLRPWDPRCPRMVCRVRHKDDDLRAGVGAQRGVGMHRAWVDQHRQAEKAEKQSLSPNAPTLELPDHNNSQSSSSNHRSSASFASTNSSFLIHHFPKRYFILKSLTITDLEEAVKTCLWKTQRHNQPILDQAFRTSQDVFLIFGANRSGEFFGYAKMVAPSIRIRTPEPRSAHRSTYASINSLSPLGPGHDDPRARPQLSTPAPIREEGEAEREPAPRSATDPYYRRASTAFLHPGTRAASPGPIEEEDELLSPFAALEVSPKPDEGMFRSESPEMFEEALRRASVNTLDPNLLRGRRESTRYSRHALMEQSTSLQIPVGGHVTRKETMPAAGNRKETTDPPKADDGGSDGLAAPFRLQWVQVAPLSFFRTRHLRNPWNGDREVKVSRDGTEVEPNVGALLIQEWEKLAANLPTGEEVEETGGSGGGSGDKAAAASSGADGAEVAIHAVGGGKTGGGGGGKTGGGGGGGKTGGGR